MKTKICSACKQEKSFDDFYKLSSSPTGLQSRCKACAKKHYEENKEYLLKQHYEWVDNNREKHNQYRAKSYQKNRDKYLAIAKRYYNTIKGKINNRIRQHKRRARKNAAEGFHTYEDIKNIYNKQQGKCAWCGCFVGEKYHVDHVIPLSRGGSDFPENLVISCQTCNQKKWNKLPSEWLK
jgi:5-methylcytosine-specific restriction endonuclease McrA